MTFPAGFQAKYLALLGPEEGQAFLDSFKLESESGFRVNPLKASQSALPESAQPMPGTPWGYYGKVAGSSTAHVTGLVYSQEPAAQMVGQAAAPQPGLKVLDLAAAPGGKSTHLLSYLDNQGLLVANEIHPKRSKILAENLERFGARNVVATNESPERLAQVFPAYFDLIVLDAPCSGEGMFRKQAEAMDYWTPEYPSQCAALQREILEQALLMLKPGGTLVYSTCTWAPEENEDIVAWLLEHYPLTLLEVPKLNGMVPGLSYAETARMYPQHFRGEGQFVAKFCYEGQETESKSRKFKPLKAKVTADQLKLWQDFAASHLTVTLPGVLQTFGDHLYLLPEGLPDLGKLRIAHKGLHLGEFKKKRFEPSFALGLALRPDETVSQVALSEEQVTRYLAGETVDLAEDKLNGWYQVLAGGNGLGFAKVTGRVLKNYYPKGLRLRRS